MSPSELAERVRGRLPDVVVARGEVAVVVDRGALIGALRWFKEDEGFAFDLLASLTATDWPDRSPRYWVAYELYSMRYAHRLRVKVGLEDGDGHVPTVTTLFPTADWHEREVFDLYGIRFDGHPNLRRILLPDGWDGHPLRKTEELGGVNTRYRGAFVPPVDRRTS